MNAPCSAKTAELLLSPWRMLLRIPEACVTSLEMREVLSLLFELFYVKPVTVPLQTNSE